MVSIQNVSQTFASQLLLGLLSSSKLQHIKAAAVSYAFAFSVLEPIINSINIFKAMGAIHLDVYFGACANKIEQLIFQEKIVLLSVAFHFPSPNYVNNSNGKDGTQ